MSHKFHITFIALFFGFIFLAITSPTRIVLADSDKQIKARFTETILQRVPRYVASRQDKALAACIDWQKTTIDFVRVYNTFWYYIGDTDYPIFRSDLMNQALHQCEKRKSPGVDCQCVRVAADNSSVLRVPKDVMARLLKEQRLTSEDSPKDLAALQVDEQGRWQQLENNPNCVVWNAYPHQKETVTWSGACANGKAQGHGVLVFANGDRYEVWMNANGDRYEGEWKDGEEHGRGLFVWGPDSQWPGDRYEGDWKDGKRDGRGVFVWVDAVRYEGDWKDGKKTGRGVQVWANGNKYEGDWKDNEKHGRGVLVWGPDSQWPGHRYEGEWKDGEEHGRGVYFMPNGARYEGEWKDGNWHGRGVYVGASGDRYEGEWKDDKRHGHGVQASASGNTCEGDWREDTLLNTGKGWDNRTKRWRKCVWDGNTTKFTD